MIFGFAPYLRVEGSARPSPGWTWMPRTLTDTQVLSAVLLHEVARAEQREEQWLDNLRQQADSDLGALRQLGWILLSQARTYPSEELRTVLERWVQRSPDEPDPRLALFMLPVLGRGVVSPPNKGEHLAKLNETYEWFEARHPDVSRYVANLYVHILMSFGEQEAARTMAERAIDRAADLMELSQVIHVVGPLGDAELLGKLLTRIQFLQQQSAGGSAPWLGVADVLRQFVELAGRDRDWDRLLKYFEEYMAPWLGVAFGILCRKRARPSPSRSPSRWPATWAAAKRATSAAPSR
jgi:hypothetical protein